MFLGRADNCASLYVYIYRHMYISHHAHVSSYRQIASWIDQLLTSLDIVQLRLKASFSQESICLNHEFPTSDFFVMQSWRAACTLKMFLRVYPVNQKQETQIFRIESNAKRFRRNLIGHRHQLTSGNHSSYDSPFFGLQNTRRVEAELTSWTNDRISGYPSAGLITWPVGGQSTVQAGLWANAMTGGWPTELSCDETCLRMRRFYSEFSDAEDFPSIF